MSDLVPYHIELYQGDIELDTTEFSAVNLLSKVVTRGGGRGAGSWSSTTFRDLYYTMVF